MKRILTTSVIIIASLALIGFILTKNKKENEEKIAIVAEKNASVSVKTATVKTAQISIDFAANGLFEPVQEKTLTTEKTGKVAQRKEILCNPPSL